MKIKNSKSNRRSRRITASKSVPRRTRRKYIRAAKDDFIKIGNMVLPKNAASYGNADYDTVQKSARKAYDEEVRKEKEAKAKADAVAKGQNLYDQTVVEIEVGGKDDPLGAAFNILVPRSGKADTSAGELVRAMSRLNYRWYNDGDKFYEGYGLETCASSAAYLIDNVPKSTKIPDLLYGAAESLGDDTYYKDILEKCSNLLVDYLLDHPELFGEPAKADSRDYESETVDEIEAMGHSHEYDIDTWAVEAAIEHGWTTWEDFLYFLDDLCSYYGGEVHGIARDAFVIIDLTSEQYSEWEEQYPNEVENYVEELMAEHADEEDEDFEDDEEY